MIRTRIIELSIETEETVTVHRPGAGLAWCPRCAREALIARPETAAAATGLSTREIYRRVESGAAHFQESADGRLSVCIDSLVNRGQSDDDDTSLTARVAGERNM